MILEIRARFSCDRCAAEFTVPLDPAYQPPSGWCILQVAEDGIRSGLDYRDSKDRFGIDFGSVRKNKHLCADCSNNKT